MNKKLGLCRLLWFFFKKKKPLSRVKDQKNVNNGIWFKSFAKLKNQRTLVITNARFFFFASSLFSLRSLIERQNRWRVSSKLGFVIDTFPLSTIIGWHSQVAHFSFFRRFRPQTSPYGGTAHFSRIAALFHTGWHFYEVSFRDSVNQIFAPIFEYPSLFLKI